MLEEAKALAVFLREGGAFAGLAISLVGNGLLYLRERKLQEQLLDQEKSRREELGKLQERYSAEYVELLTQVTVTLQGLDRGRKSRTPRPRTTPPKGSPETKEGDI